MTHEDGFREHVCLKIDEARTLTGHHFSDLRELFTKLGELEAARLLTSPGTSAGFTYGFQILASAGLLRLSVEQAVIDFADSGLFTDEHLSKARAVLAMARMLGGRAMLSINGSRQ